MRIMHRSDLLRLGKEVVSWQAGELQHYSTAIGASDAPADDCSDIVVAEANHQNFFPMGGGDSEHLARLAAAGVVDPCAPGWKLTKVGIASLKTVIELTSPTPVLRVRPDIPLADRTTVELLITLQSDGWRLKAWPRGRPPTHTAAAEDKARPEHNTYVGGCYYTRVKITHICIT